MSRGGRGRGGGRPGDLKGVTWDRSDEDGIKLETKPSDLFPAHPNLKRPFESTESEKRQITHFKALQSKIRRGPLYTQSTKRTTDVPVKIFGEDQYNRQYGTNKKADMDPFNSMETYANRMAPPTNDFPKLSERPFNKELFPKELWSTLEGREGKEVRKTLDKVEKRKAALAGTEQTERQKALFASLGELPDEDGEDVDDEDKDEVEEDSEFDDEDMGGDYDGEQYFDNGEEGSENGDGGGDEEY